jgi:O-succinylbenzoic acid--CoA ligase
VPELVALDLDQGPLFPSLIEGIWSRGDAVCVIDTRLRGIPRERQLATLLPTRAIREDGEEARLHGGRGVEAGDALVIATSGSSSDPKAVVHTHAAIAASAHATSQRLDVEPDADSWLCCLPCTHIGGFSVIARALVTATPVEVHERFDPDAVQASAARGATLVSLVSTALARLEEPTAFRTIVLGGAAPPGNLPRNAVVTWGMTETGSGVVYDGRPLDDVQIAELDGELWVKGPMLARAFRDGTPIGAIGPDGEPGWLATGDAGTVSDGVVAVFGRIADVITTGGEKVWPGDVERVLSAHPGIAEVAVWKRPDPEWGERVVAYVVPAGEAPSLDELRVLVADNLAPWCSPKEVVVVARLPRASSGKVVRRLLEVSADPA